MEMIEKLIECPDCKATGLYAGMAERCGDAVVCSKCKGTGAYLFKLSYEPFVERKKHKTALRVFQANPGIFTHPDAVPGGVPVATWEADPLSAAKPGAEMREHTCPAWWYQSADYDKKPDWDDCNRSLGRTFSRCPKFRDKAACWRRWDSEQ